MLVEGYPIDRRANQAHAHPALQARDTGLYVIGVFKIAKAFLFVAISIGALHFLHHDLGASIERLVYRMGVDPENRLVNLVLTHTGLITHHRLRLISLGTFLYAVLCTVEGTGLLLRKVWAEYVTLWLSISFVPWEAFELLKKPDVWRTSILMMNVVIIVYLLWMLRRKRRVRSLVVA